MALTTRTKPPPPTLFCAHFSETEAGTGPVIVAMAPLAPSLPSSPAPSPLAPSAVAPGLVGHSVSASTGSAST
jgi:hypothetical protein